MASLKESILRESHGYKGSYLVEDYTMTNFIKGFNEDYQEFGEGTADLYKALFLLGEDVKLDKLQENIDEVSSMIDGPFLFEDVLMEKSFYDYQQEQQAELEREGNWNPGKDIGAPRTLSPEDMKLARANPWGPKKAPLPINRKGELPIDGEASKEAMKATFEKAASASTPEEAIKILKTAQSPSAAVGTVAAVKGIAKGATADKGISTAVKGAVTAPVKKAGILGWISKAFGKVKNFFTGGVSSVGAAIKSGNWASLLKIPMVQGALAVGGSVLAFKLLKKLFGKKIEGNQEAQLKAALARK